MESRGSSLPTVAREWTGIMQFPVTTQASLHELLERLRKDNRDSLTILVLGKSGVGKSSTVNSIFGERVCVVSAFQSETIRPTVASRTRAGFTVNVIDTPGLVEAGCVNDQAVDAIRRFILDKPVDVVLYVDRLDGYRVDSLDRQIPIVLVENSGRCATNDEGEKILPNKTVWLTNLMRTIVEVVTAEKAAKYTIDERMIKGTDGNWWHKLITVPLFLFQLKVLYPLIRARIFADIDEGTEDE
ncbi:hypothetical protein CBR_g51479 [Chara braunii]|uniref:AIG1-type G domain-containing protein n=1 Tax=Chara braunii TaxID=69332 RepID=A0A388K6C9_CHABU|nr:hypothetical protein CBR_g51479 [Chara braunii]|eukprot:GBG65597.1 hypothetical protein CBR_g51479 [Chara braunii]